MGMARNNAVILSEQAPQGAVGSDVMSVGLYTTMAGGTPIGGMDISTDPDPLTLGQRYEIAVGALELHQPANGGDELTQLSAASASGATTITVDAVGNLQANEHIVLNGEAYSIMSVAGVTRIITLNEALRANYAVDVSVQVALETHEMTLRKLRGAISGGLYVAYFSSLWAATNTGTLNLIALARSAVAESAWTVS